MEIVTCPMMLDFKINRKNLTMGNVIERKNLFSKSCFKPN